MKTRNILLRFLNHLPNGKNERKKEMKEKIQIHKKKKYSLLPHGAAMQMLLSAKAAHLIILIVTLPLLATSCRDRDNEPSAGSGKLITVSRLQVSINGMQSVAEMNTRADATPDENGYIGAEKKKFVPGDVLHFVVALTSDDRDKNNIQVFNATLQADDANGTNTWRFDHPLELPQDPTETYLIQAFYDGTKRLYTHYSNETGGTNTAAHGNANAAFWDARKGTKDNATLLTTYPDLLFAIKGSPGITLTPDGRLTLPFPHEASLVRISSIENRLGAEVTVIRANATDLDESAPTTISLYSAAATKSSAAGPAADASAAAVSRTMEALIGSTNKGTSYLKSFTVTLDDSRKFIVPVPGNNNPGLKLDPGASYSYRLILLPGSVSAEEDGGTAPSYKVRRDAAVPAGYIPIYSADDLRKIGSNDPAIVNDYLYTNASSAILAAEAQKDPIYDATTGAYTDSGHSQDATNAAIASGGIAPNAAPTSDGTNNVGHLTFSLDARYILMNDIDLTPTSVPVDKEFTNINNVDQVELWKPIGTDNQHPFTGRFHGNGFTIRGMTINSNAMEVGLFGFTRGAVIYNVHLQDARVKGMGINLGNLGSLVGNCQYSTISLCSATGCALKATGENAYVGGLVGLVASGTITRSYATTCTLSGGDGLKAGGLVSHNKGTLASCYTAGCAASFTAGSTNSFGGLAGENSAIIYGCYATYAQKSGTGTGNFGSLVGTNTSYGGTIGSSYAINAASSTLGLVGSNNSGIITACVSPFETSSSSGASPSSDGKQDNGGGSYWEVIADASTPTKYTGGYAPLTNTDLLATLSNSSNPSFTSEGYLAEVRTLLVNDRITDIVKDMGGGEDNGITYGALDKIPPGGIYTEKIEWRARSIWGGSTAPKSFTVVLPRIDWEFNGEEN